MSDIEDVILRSLQYNEDYARKVIPFLKEDYFGMYDPANKIYFETVLDHFYKYNSLPNKQTLLVEFQNKKVNEKVYNALIEKAQEYDTLKDSPDPNWLLNQSEQFCKDQAWHLAMQEAVSISNGDNKNLSTTAIPDIMQKALAVSFDSNIGHDYINDAMKRWEFYNQKTNKVPFHLSMLNKITDGGAEFKTINAVLAGTGVGKTIWLCDLAANYALMGYDVLYITLEVEEKKIAQRIDANLMNTIIGDVRRIPKVLFEDKIKQLKAKMKGRIIIKEYGTGGAHAGHFRALLTELKTKQNFVPRILIVDYLTICASARVKNRADMFLYNMSITEELRCLCQEYNMMGWTATQSNRDGLDNSEMGMKNTGMSIGTAFTFDFYLGLMVDEQLAQMGQCMVKQLGKNRYGDSQQDTKFIIGLDRARMRFHDLNNTSTAIVPPNQNVAQTKVQGIKP